MERKPIRALMVQLSPLADQLQLLMAIRAAKQLYPELELHLVVEASAEEAVRSLDWVKKVHVFSKRETLAMLKSDADDMNSKLSSLATWIEPILDVNYDLLVNWTFNDSSSFLSAIIPSPVKLGYSRKTDLSISIQDGWSHYIKSVVQSEILQDIHLTDLLTTQLLTALQVHFGDSVDPGAQTVTSKSFFKLSRRDHWAPDTWGHPSRRWMSIEAPEDQSPESIDRIARFAALVLRRHDDQNIIVIGNSVTDPVRYEKQFLKQLKIHHPHLRGDRSRVIFKLGAISFSLWAEILSDCNWIIADSGPSIALASCVGTRALLRADRADDCLETGPYGNSHYIVETRKGELMYAAWTYASTEWQHRRELSIDQHLARLQFDASSDLRILRSRIRNSEEGGGVVFDPLHRYEESVPRWSGKVWSYLARDWFCGWVPEIEWEMNRASLSPNLVREIRGLEEPTQVLQKLFEQGDRLARELTSATKNLRSDSIMTSHQKSEVLRIGGELNEIEKLIGRTCAVNSTLGGFFRMHQAILHNLKGTRLHELAQETSEAYQFLQIGSEHLSGWIHATLELSKPIPLPKGNVFAFRRDDRTQTP